MTEPLRCPWPVVVLALHSYAVLACGETNTLVQRPSRFADSILVQRPPPVVPVDIQAARPAGDAVWVPGSWSWRAAGWSWNPGAWVDAPAGASWSPWTWCYQADGQVRFWPARWFGPNGQTMDDPPPLSAGSVELSETTLAALRSHEVDHLTTMRAGQMPSAATRGPGRLRVRAATARPH